MLGLCCCGDDGAGSCDPGPCPEEAEWHIDVARVAKTPPGPTFTFRGGRGPTGIQVPNQPGCVVAVEDDDGELEQVAGDLNTGSIPTYRCESLETPGPQVFRHAATLAVADGSRLWQYRASWSLLEIWGGFQGGWGNGLGTSTWLGGVGGFATPIPPVIERLSYNGVWSVFERLQDADSSLGHGAPPWRELYPECLQDSEHMFRCYLALAISGTVLEAWGPSQGQTNWGHVPVIRYRANMVVGRAGPEHGYGWIGCPLTSCCQWTPERASIRVTRVDPAPQHLDVVRGCPAGFHFTDDSPCESWPESLDSNAIYFDMRRRSREHSITVQAEVVAGGDAPSRTLIVHVPADETEKLSLTQKAAPYRWRLVVDNGVGAEPLVLREGTATVRDPHVETIEIFRGLPNHYLFRKGKCPHSNFASEANATLRLGVFRNGAQALLVDATYVPESMAVQATIPAHETETLPLGDDYVWRILRGPVAATAESVKTGHAIVADPPNQGNPAP